MIGSPPGEELVRDAKIMRYTAADDFGRSEMTSPGRNFWYADALHQLGRREDAHERFVEILPHRNRLGILSEDIDAATGGLWDHVPQIASMAALINSAMRLSQSWEEARCLDL